MSDLRTLLGHWSDGETEAQRGERSCPRRFHKATARPEAGFPTPGPSMPALPDLPDLRLPELKFLEGRDRGCGEAEFRTGIGLKCPRAWLPRAG